MEKTAKKIWIGVGILVIIVVVVLGIMLNVMAKRYSDSKQEADKNRQLYQTEKSANANLNATKEVLNLRVDSAQKTIKELSAYQPLVSAMIERDKIQKTLKYRPGDFARLKIDSSKVVIIGIIIGGGKYSYTLKYKIQKDRDKEEEINPELLY